MTIWTRPSDTFEVAPIEPAYRTDTEKKRLFGLFLAMGLDPFPAASRVFTDTSEALWVSLNWLADPLVKEVAEKEEKSLKLLDKEAVASKVLEFYNEKDFSGRFFINDSKDRLSALRLYAEICGYIGRLEIDASNNTFVQKTMNIHLVSPKKEPECKTIEAKSSEVDNKDIVPLKVRLVS